MRDWLTWFGRWAERDEAMKRFERLQVAFGEVGEQVIALSGRTDLARRSSGATGRALEGVEEAFASTTGAYSRLSEAIDAIEVGLARGRTDGLAQAERDLAQVREGLKTLARRLDEWESLWREAPAALAGVESALAALKATALRVGNPSEIAAKIANLEAYLAKAQATLAGGNPTEAKAQAADLRLALEKVGAEAGEYLSAQSALAEAEGDLQRAIEVWRRFQAVVESSTPLPEPLAVAQVALEAARQRLVAGDLDGVGRELYRLREALRAHKG
jgi:chromosome segregation ATPase